MSALGAVFHPYHHIILSLSIQTGADLALAKNTLSAQCLVFLLPSYQLGAAALRCSPPVLMEIVLA